MKWTARPEVNWPRVEKLEKLIPLDRISELGIAPYSNWFIMRTSLTKASPEIREAIMMEYARLYTEYKPVIDEMMNLMFSDVPPNWFDITFELAGR
jgi:hypothetical protein